ncbi:MAG: tol-pal system protein YbgF [Nitrospirae bacterium]|nr:MAG: tol-pal system protein YbgF [Nitrospirota bacterium]
MKRFSGVFLLLILLISGCASTDEYQSLRAELNQLKSDYYRDVRDLKERLRLIEATTAKAARQDTITGLRESQESILNQVNDLRKEVQLIQGRLDEGNYKTEKDLRDASTERDLLRAELSEVRTSLSELEKKVASLSVPPKPSNTEQASGEGTATPTTSQPPAVKGPEERYQEALGLFNSGKWKEARDAFEAFLEDYPSMELSDNAQFWIAESYYKENNYEDAILAYERLIKKFPKSDKVPGAMLKQAYAFRALGDQNTTQVILKTLKERFPDSREAAIADKELGKADKPAPPQGEVKEDKKTE